MTKRKKGGIIKERGVMGYRQVGKAQDFDSCIPLVRVQLSQPIVSFYWNLLLNFLTARNRREVPMGSHSHRGASQRKEEMKMKTPFVGGDFKMTSPYGMRTLNGVEAFHGGVDLVGLSSKQICAVTGGKVIRSRIVTDKTDSTWQWGNYVAVAGDDGNTIYYCHMKERKVAVGDRVEVGDVLGIEGNTGYSFGAHLHFEVRDKKGVRINAADYLGIPNKVGTYKVEEGEDLENRIEALEKTVGEVYDSLADCPAWAKPTVEKLINNGILKGDENGNLNLSYQMLRMFVILDRSGAFE